jgi:hypothetical protein
MLCFVLMAILLSALIPLTPVISSHHRSTARPPLSPTHHDAVHVVGWTPFWHSSPTSADSSHVTVEKHWISDWFQSPPPAVVVEAPVIIANKKKDMCTKLMYLFSSPPTAAETHAAIHVQKPDYLFASHATDAAGTRIINKLSKWKDLLLSTYGGEHENSVPAWRVLYDWICVMSTGRLATSLYIILFLFCLLVLMLPEIERVFSAFFVLAILLWLRFQMMFSSFQDDVWRIYADQNLRRELSEVYDI